jgi:hypothetical protein
MLSRIAFRGLLVAVGLIAVQATVRADESFGELSVDEVAKRVGRPGVWLIDNNPRELWAKGHVPGARWLQYDAITAADLPTDKSATLIFYCANEH